ncbi:flavodoxin domain-containing protein [Candidatus Peribacteria bacterium]|nr:flavodoxin domain-containing protein [Candidatus Peribacteria bacterium]
MQREILVLYASTGGNTAWVAQQIHRTLAEQGLQSTLLPVERCTQQQLESAGVLLWGSPTYGHGHTDLRCARLLQQVQGAQLEGKPCAVFGLGDTKYDADYHIESATILEDFITSHGGHLLTSALRIDKSPLPHLPAIEDWARTVARALGE